MKSKYNVELSDLSVRTTENIIFDSKLEKRYYEEVVKPKLENGEILHCDMQKQFELQPKFKYKGKNVRAITYVADFVVTYKDGHIEVIDTKGFPDQKALLKRKMFWYTYPEIEYKWVGYSKIDGGWIDYEELKVKRAGRKKTDKNKTYIENT